MPENMIDMKNEIDRETYDKLKSKNLLEEDGVHLKEGFNNKVRDSINKMYEESYRITEYKEPYKKLQYMLINAEAPKENKKAIELFIQDYNGVKAFSNIFHLFNVDETLNQILLHTTNKVFVRPLPFRDIILNTDIVIDGRRIQGIIVNYFNSEDVKGIGIEPIKKLDESTTEIHVDTWMITLLEYPYETLGGITSDEDRKKAVLHSLTIPYNTKSDEYIKNEKWFEKIEEYICNFIDFIQEKEVEIVVNKIDEDKIRKRIKRGQEIVPNICNIRLNGKMKTYYDGIKTGLTIHYTHRFWVQGHWRHFKSKRYKNKFGQKEFIQPFIKGKGILIQKEYNVVGQ